MSSSEANEVVDCVVGVIRMLDLDRDFIYAAYGRRATHAQERHEYYGWPDFIRDALLTYAAQELP